MNRGPFEVKIMMQVNSWDPTDVVLVGKTENKKSGKYHEDENISIATQIIIPFTKLKL